MNGKNHASDPRLDRPSETALSTARWATPWETEAGRGDLALTRDLSQHRRFHSHFEDMLN